MKNVNLEVVRRMLLTWQSQCEYNIKDAELGGTTDATGSRVDLEYIRGFRDGMAAVERKELPDPLVCIYNKVRVQMDKEADPEYRDYLRLHAKFNPQ